MGSKQPSIRPCVCLSITVFVWVRVCAPAHGIVTGSNLIDNYERAADFESSSNPNIEQPKPQLRCKAGLTEIQEATHFSHQKLAMRLWTTYAACWAGR